MKPASGAAEKASSQPSPTRYFVLVFLISLPFWLLGAVAHGLAERLPINLPISALMFVCPLLAALILERRAEGQGGVICLLRRSMYFRRIGARWYLPTLLLMPALLAASYIVMRLLELPLPEPHVALGALPLFLAIFFAAALSEELGWTGYAFGPLQGRYGALGAGLLLSFVWGVWHIVPYLQADRSASWIFWQVVCSALIRVLMAWLYGHTSGSVLAAALFHMSINVSVFLFPNYGSHYDPLVTSVLAALVAGLVVVLRGFRPRRKNASGWARAARAPPRAPAA